jgi:hypothetical protein
MRVEVRAGERIALLRELEVSVVGEVGMLYLDFPNAVKTFTRVGGWSRRRFDLG